MGKFSAVLLFFCLLGFGKLEAQTDSTTPPVKQAIDTALRVAPVKHDSVRHMTHADSVRRDSLRRVRRALRDSLARVDSLKKADSLARLAGTATTATTPTTVASPAKTAAPPPAERQVVEAHEGPPAMDFWKKVLAGNRYFHFTGTPVVFAFQLHRANSKDSLFYLIVGILFYFALTRVFFEKYFNNLLTLFFRVSLRQQQIREQVLQTPLPSLLLNILFIISGGLFACYLLHFSRMGADIRFWVLYLYCMLLLAAVYLVKFVVLKFIGWVFSVSRATDIYIFIVFLVNKMLGIFLLPFLIIITFSGPTVREIFITISLAMVFVLWGYRVLAAYRPVRNEIKLTPFYFFLYLCAFEIAPLLLIYKVLLTYLEKVY